MRLLRLQTSKTWTDRRHYWTARCRRTANFRRWYRSAKQKRQSEPEPEQQKSLVVNVVSSTLPKRKSNGFAFFFRIIDVVFVVVEGGEVVEILKR